jgi:hypothetical protein
MSVDVVPIDVVPVDVMPVDVMLSGTMLTMSIDTGSIGTVSIDTASIGTASIDTLFIGLLLEDRGRHPPARGGPLRPRYEKTSRNGIDGGHASEGRRTLDARGMQRLRGKCAPVLAGLIPD